MPKENDPTYEHWKERLAKEMSALGARSMIVAHSVGVPILIEYLAKRKLPKPLTALFLLAAPYFGKGGWSANGLDIGEQVKRENFASQVAESLRVFFYHNRDDSVIPFTHIELYKEQLPEATFRAFDHGGHQFDDGLNHLVRDIKRV